MAAADVAQAIANMPDLPSGDAPAQPAAPAAPPPKERAYSLSTLKVGERTVSEQSNLEQPAETQQAEAKPGEQPATEGEQTEAKPPEKPAEPLAKQHAALTRRIRAAEEVERRAEQRAKDAEARELKLKQAEQEFESMSEDALLEAVAKRKGMTLDELVKRGIQRIANGGKPQPDHELDDVKRKLSKLEQDKLAEAKQREEDAARNSQAAVDTFISSTLDLITEDAHPLISDLESSELSRRVLAVAEAYASKTGRAPDRREVLDYLEQQELARTEARVARLNGKQPAAEPQQTNPASAGAVPGNGKPEPQTRTLTNTSAAESTGRAQQPPADPRELIAWAAQVIPD